MPIPAHTVIVALSCCRSVFSLPRIENCNRMVPWRASNWRWAAKQILNYTIVATLTRMLDQKQRVDQIGFTPVTGVDGRFVVLDGFAERLTKLNITVLWLACRHAAWTSALACLYHDQFGMVNGIKRFRLETRVRQGHAQPIATQSCFGTHLLDVDTKIWGWYWCQPMGGIYHNEICPWHKRREHLKQICNADWRFDLGPELSRA